MQWIASNAGSIICGLAVLAIAAAALRSWFRSRKKGCGCSGGCGSCGACGMCGTHGAAGDKEEK